MDASASLDQIIGLSRHPGWAPIRQRSPLWVTVDLVAASLAGGPGRSDCDGVIVRWVLLANGPDRQHRQTIARESRPAERDNDEGLSERVSRGNWSCRKEEGQRGFKTDSNQQQPHGGLPHSHSELLQGGYNGTKIQTLLSNDPRCVKVFFMVQMCTKLEIC